MAQVRRQFTDEFKRKAVALPASSAAQCGSSMDLPVAPTAPNGITNAETLVATR
jgi:hypothetical protein